MPKHGVDSRSTAMGGDLHLLLSPKRKRTSKPASSKKATSAHQPNSTQCLDNIATPLSSPRGSHHRIDSSSSSSSSESNSSFQNDLSRGILCNLSSLKNKNIPIHSTLNNFNESNFKCSLTTTTSTTTSTKMTTTATTIALSAATSRKTSPATSVTTSASSTIVSTRATSSERRTPPLHPTGYQTRSRMNSLIPSCLLNINLNVKMKLENPAVISPGPDSYSCSTPNSYSNEKDFEKSFDDISQSEKRPISSYNHGNRNEIRSERSMSFDVMVSQNNYDISQLNSTNVSYNVSQSNITEINITEIREKTRGRSFDENLSMLTSGVTESSQGYQKIKVRSLQNSKNSIMSTSMGNVSDKYSDKNLIKSNNQRVFIYPGSENFRQKPKEDEWMSSFEGESDDEIINQKKNQNQNYKKEWESKVNRNTERSRDRGRDRGRDRNCEIPFPVGNCSDDENNNENLNLDEFLVSDKIDFHGSLSALHFDRKQEQETVNCDKVENTDSAVENGENVAVDGSKSVVTVTDCTDNTDMRTFIIDTVINKNESNNKFNSNINPNNNSNNDSNSDLNNISNNSTNISTNISINNDNNFSQIGRSVSSPSRIITKIIDRNNENNNSPKRKINDVAEENIFESIKNTKKINNNTLPQNLHQNINDDITRNRNDRNASPTSSFSSCTVNLPKSPHPYHSRSNSNLKSKLNSNLNSNLHQNSNPNSNNSMKYSKSSGSIFSPIDSPCTFLPKKSISSPSPKRPTNTTSNTTLNTTLNGTSTLPSPLHLSDSVPIFSTSLLSPFRPSFPASFTTNFQSNTCSSSSSFSRHTHTNSSPYPYHSTSLPLPLSQARPLPLFSSIDLPLSHTHTPNSNCYSTTPTPACTTATASISTSTTTSLTASADLGSIFRNQSLRDRDPSVRNYFFIFYFFVVPILFIFFRFLFSNFDLDFDLISYLHYNLCKSFFFIILGRLF